MVSCNTLVKCVYNKFAHSLLTIIQTKHLLERLHPSLISCVEEGGHNTTHIKLFVQCIDRLDECDEITFKLNCTQLVSTLN